MNVGQRRLIETTLRAALWLCVAWILILVAHTGWERWMENRPREYRLEQPTTSERGLKTLGETASTLVSDQAWLFWSPLVLGIAAYWGRRFIVLGDDSESPAEQKDSEA
jgi:hypothetical protein